MKNGYVAKEGYTEIAWNYRDDIRKEKVQDELRIQGTKIKMFPQLVQMKEKNKYSLPREYLFILNDFKCLEPDKRYPIVSKELGGSVVKHLFVYEVCILQIS